MNNTGATIASGAQSGTGAVYAIGSGNTPYIQSSYSDAYVSGSKNTGNVVQYYTTANGQVVMSNADGNPISYPNSGAPGYWFRQGEPVQFVPNASATAVATDTSWVVDPTTDTITYTISDFSALNLGNNIAISWAMTCANSIIQGAVDFNTGTNLPPVPLPGALPLFAGGLMVLGFASGWRRKQRAGLVAA